MTNPPNLKVVQLDVGPLQDVPAMLRKIARKIDDGEIEKPTRAILLTEREDGSIDVYGLGDSGDVVRAIGMLNIATFTLTRGYDAEVMARRGS